MEAVIIQLALGLVTALPSEIATIKGVFANVSGDLSAATQAQLTAAFDAANARLDTDMARFDGDAALHGG